MKTKITAIVLFALLPALMQGQQPLTDNQGHTPKGYNLQGEQVGSLPVKAGETWNSIGPFGGDVLDIALDYADPLTLFAATGVPYVSHNGGETWQVIESLYNLAAAPIERFETSPGGTIYASGPYSSYKIFRSDDGGETWVQKAIPVNGSGLNIAIDPVDPNTVYVGLSSVIGLPNNNVVIKSTDQGETWTWFNLTGILPVGYSVVSLAIDPGNTQTIFAIGREGFSNSRVAASFDGGSTWENRTGSLPSTKPLNHVTIVDGKVYIAGGQLFGSQVVGVYKSENYGQSWQNISTNFPNKVTNYILVDPINPDKMYAASEGDGVYYTVNGGLTWNYNTSGAGNTGAARSLHFEPGNNSSVYAGYLSLGVCKSTNSGGSWYLANKGIANLLTNDIEVNPVNPMQILVAFEAENSGGCYLSNDGGETWQVIETLPGTRFSQVDIGADGSLYAWSNGPSSIAQEGLYKSVDGGATWDNKGPNIGDLFETQIWGLKVSDSNPQIILIGGNNFGVNGWASVVHLTMNGGDDWVNVYTGLDNDSFKYVYIDPGSTNEVMYAGYSTGNAHSGFIKSIDGGFSWDDINTGLPGEAKWCGAIVSQAGNGSVLYGAVGGYGDMGGTILKSTDGGNTWNTTSLLLGFWSRVNDLLISPLDTAIIYAATAQDGVYITSDGGNTWEATSPAIPATNITRFSRPFIVDDTAYFCASTFSNSAFKTRIYNPITSVNPSHSEKGSISILGNPSADECETELNLTESANVSINVYRVNGQLLQNIEESNLEPGNYRYHVQLNPGVYILSGKIDGQSTTKKLIIR